MLSIHFHDFYFLEIGFFILFVELVEELILVPHLLWNFGEQVENKMLQGFLWSVDDQLLVP
jgi:hypothetical protein